MPYCAIAAIRNGAACSAVAHSEGNGAPSQVFEVGAIESNCEAAEAAARGVMKDMCGTATAYAKVAKGTSFMILKNIAYACAGLVFVYFMV